MLSALPLVCALSGLLAVDALALPLQNHSKAVSNSGLPQPTTIQSGIQQRSPARAKKTRTKTRKTTSSTTTAASSIVVDNRVASTSSASVATTIAASTSAVATSSWDPPSSLVAPLSSTWEHEMSTYSNPLTFMNYGFDQVIAGKGKINYCVRWESTDTVDAANRTKVESAIRQSFNQWIEKLAGFDGFPYDTVDVNVVGWAVKDKSLLTGDVSDIEVYTTTDDDGIPQCDPLCGRFFHQDGDYSGCPAGADRHYDQSAWFTAGMDGGAGGDWGQRVGAEYFMEEIDSSSIHIILHEMGHTFALDDFYDWMPDGVTNFIMNAGSSTVITDFDAWMVRDWWRHIKSRYSL